MQFESVTTTEAILALLADGLTLLLLAALIISRLAAPWRQAWLSLRAALASVALPLAWMVAIISTLGSLYLSEIAHLVPCRLCWYQRIAMYPLVILLGIATARRDLITAKRYLLPLALGGGLISIYHYQLERVPGQPTFSCGFEAPCSIPVVNVWGWVSVPFMALAGFALISALLLMAKGIAADE